MTKQITILDTSKLTLAALAAIYNEASEHPVKKFSDKPAAIKRVALALDQAAMVATDSPAPGEDSIDEVAPGVWVMPRAVMEAANRASRPAGKRGKTSDLADSCTVTLLVAENPKRPGTAAHDQYELYRKHTTVGALRAAGVTLRTLHWDFDRGYVSVEK